MTLKAKLRAKATTIGSWLSFDYEPTAEMMARSGFEWLVIDMEHTATAADGMGRLIRTIDLAGCVPLVRVGANDPLLIKQALDSGAEGVIVPMICTRAEAEAAARSAHYPPEGTRGVGLWRAQGYGSSFPAYKERAARDTVLIVQIEHWQAVENLDDILAVPAVDGFIIGPYDLSGSIGDPGNFEHPRFVECLEKVERCARDHSKPGGYHLVHPDAEGSLLRQKLAAGYRFIAYGTDMIFFGRQVQAEVERLRTSGHLAPVPGPRP